MKESEFQTKVIQTLNWYGLRYYHTFDSRRSVAGFPDLVVVGPNGVLFLELKTEKGKVSPQQMAWIDALDTAGATARIVRPSDFDDLVVHFKRISGR